MKSAIYLLVITIFLNTSCLTIQGIKKPIVLVDSKTNCKVSYQGESVDVEDVTAFREEMTQGNTKHVTLYKYPGVKIKLRKNTEIEIKEGDKSNKVKIKTKPAIGLLIFEGIFTCGIGTIIDLASGAFWVTKNRYIDVPAVLDNKTQREQKELKNKVKEDFKPTSKNY